MTAGRTSPCAAGYGAADWRSLAAHRADPRGEEPEGWAAALDHLDRCADCRKAALAADPTLVFRRLSAPAVSAPLAAGAADSEVAAMRQAVAALREASRLGATAGAGREVGTTRYGWTRALPRAAAAAALAAAMALAAGSAGHAPMPPTPSSAPAMLARAVPALASAAATTAPAELARVAPAALAQMPLLEETNRPNARIYQIEDVDLSVVWIVDKKLDV